MQSLMISQRLMISYYTLSDHRPPTGYRVAIMGVIIRLGQAVRCTRSLYINALIPHFPCSRPSLDWTA